MATSRILGPDGQPIQYDVLTQEVSAPAVASIRQVWHGSVATGLTPHRLASILDAAARGHARDYLTLAEEMEERDMHYASVLGTRKLALVGLDVRVESATDGIEDVRRADAVREIVDGAEFSDLVAHLVDALGKGYAVAEILWDRSGRTWTPTFAERDPRFFTYDQETGTELRLLDAADAVRGIPLPAYKFIVHTPKIRSGLPVRGGLARLAAVAYMCKAWAWRDWMAFADVYGMPMRVGTYGPNTSKEDVANLIAAVSNLGSDAAAVIAESTKISFEQAVQTAGAGTFFRELANWWDKQISKGVLGQTMTADDGASLSQAQVHQLVRLDIMTADARALSNTLQRQLVRPYLDLNFGPSASYPKLTVVVPKPDNTTALVDALQKLVPLGLTVEQSIVRDKLGIPDPAPDAVVLRQPVPMAPAINRALNAEAPAAPRPDATPISAMTTAGEAEAAPRWSAILDYVQNLVDTAPDLPTLRDALLAAYADLPTEQLGEVMAMGLTAAELAGRYDLTRESSGG